MQRICFIIIITIAMLGVIGCNKTTVTKNGSIQGSILLDGQTDHSGITVLLYIDNIVESEIKRVNQDYPSVGFQIESRHIFDHRKYLPLKSTITNSQGAFTFDSMNYGRYIIAYYKEDWGYDYKFDVELTSSNLTIDDLRPLHTINILPNIINSHFTLLANEVYFVSQNTYCTLASSISIEDGSTLAISPGCKLIIEGSLSIQDNNQEMVLITSSDNMYSNTIPDWGGSIDILPSAQLEVISGVMMTYLSNGIVIKSDNQTIRNSVISSCAGGIRFSWSTSHSILNNLFINNDINVSTLDAQNVAALTIEQNLFWNNAFSVGIDQTTECLLRNNYFFGGLNQLVSAWGSVSTVEYNVFSAAYTNISNSSKSNMTLKNNDIDGERCIYMGRGDYNTATQGWTTATNNNFSASEYIVFSESKFYFNGEYRPLDFANNYWSTADTVVIDNMIWDYSDQTEYSPNFVWGKIMYEPIRSTRVLSSGIQA